MINLTEMIKHIKKETYTKKDLKKFQKKRLQKEKIGWTMTLASDWNEKISKNLRNAINWFEWDEVKGILGKKKKLCFDPVWNVAFPAATHSGRKIIINTYYVLAAAGQLFPEKSLRYNRDCALFTLAHEKNHEDMFGHYVRIKVDVWFNAGLVKKADMLLCISKKLLGKCERNLALWCEECRSDIMASRKMKEILGSDITNGYIAELMHDRERYEQNPFKDGVEHPSRHFRSELVIEGEWNEMVIDKIAKHFCLVTGKDMEEIQLELDIIKVVYREKNCF